MKKIIVVLGMHRSGTSALTRGLETLGVSLGENLMPPAEGNNNKGFWEDLEIVALNDALLAQLGMNWHSLGSLHSSHDWAALLEGPLAARAEQYLSEQTGRFALFGIKDPRMSRLLPFWKGIFRRCAIEPTFLICSRDPLSVAKSLARRDGFPKGKSYYLWVEHLLCGLLETQGFQTCVVSFDRLLSGPTEELRRIATGMGLPAPENQGLQEYSEHFLDMDMRHFQHAREELVLDPDLSGLATELYGLLGRLACDVILQDDLSWRVELDSLQQRFLQLGPAYRLITVLNDQLGQREQSTLELRACLAESDRLIRDAQSEQENLRRKLAEEQRLVQKLTGRNAVLGDQLAEKVHEVHAMRNSTSWRLTRSVRLASRLLKGQRPLVAGGTRNYLLHHLKKIYWKLPARNRDQVLHLAFRTMAPLFKGKTYYEHWKASRGGFAQLHTDIGNMCLIDTVPEAEQANGTIAIHLHLYYEDLADEFVELLKNMPYRYDLFISVSSAKGHDVCSKKFIGLPLLGKLIVEQVANQGRDIAPMFCAFGSSLAAYDFIAHLHGKKSLYNSGATDGWRQYLCGNLLGSKERIRRIFSLLQGDPSKGIVYPQNYSLIPHFANSWLANKTMGAHWCARLGISPVPQGYFDFPVGTMFWARGAALKPLFDAGITQDDFAAESGQTDGTFAHCLERLLVLVCRKSGYGGAILKDQASPSWSPWRLDQCIVRSPASIAAAFADPQLKVIGFDIFDTLLCRPLLDPEATKKIVAHRAGPDVGQRYLEYRAVAESQAREQAGRDIGLSAIYTRLVSLAGFSPETGSMLMALEESVEKASLSARPGSVEVFNLALATGKKIALVSDMFLPRSVIEESLHACGFHGWDMFFLSGEVGLRKDSGKLYEHLFNHYEVHPQEFLMVGDNERSDVQIPLDMGCRILPVLKAVELARGTPRFNPLLERHEKTSVLADQISLGLILRENFSAVYFSHYDPASLVQPTPFNIGYCILGPLLTAFSQWLLDTAQRDGIERLYFLSREGQLLKRVYDLWAGATSNSPESIYLVLSRRSVIVPAIKKLEDILDIARVVYYPNTLESFLFERYGLMLDEAQWSEVERAFHLRATDIVEVKDGQIDRLVPLLRLLESSILAVARQEQADIMHYLESMDLLKYGPNAVVDIGYSGSIQNYLNMLAEPAVHGYYLITDRKSRKVARKHDVLVRGAFYEDIQRDEHLPVMYEHSFELEKLLSSSDSQVINYNRQADGMLVANFRELSRQEQDCVDLRNKIQNGVFKYVEDALSIRSELLPDFAPDLKLVRQIYENYIDQLSPAEAEMLKGFVLDDHYCGRGLV